MKAIRLFFCFSLIAALQGCIKDEKPNMEVDILDVLYQNEDILNVVLRLDGIDIYATPSIDRSNLSLEYVLSPGAAIKPDPASVTDYSEARTFTVTSEDRQWEKSYNVRVLLNEMPTKFDFENWRQPERMRYRIPYELIAEGESANNELHIWACGNEAYNFLTNKHDDYTVFPTQPTTDAHRGSYAAKLETKLTGQVDKPIAAGNLFIGQFDASMRDPRESTIFGLPFTRKPLRLRGMFKYESGGSSLASKQPDQCRIQAVLYRTDDKVKHLNGLTIKNSPNVVARAEYTGNSTPANAGYIEFDLPFEYTSAVDAATIKKGGYNLTVVFSASCNGDVYDGAPGSVLYIDDVEIICESTD